MAATKEPAFRSSISLTEFIETERDKKVPNHLLDTKIFARYGQNDILHANPSSIHFSGFEIGKSQSKKLRIINASSERQRMHIIPPSTENFRIKYTKDDTLVPGLYLEVTVQFKGSEYQNYHDCIRIHSAGKENLLVPLYAYPILDLTSFPSNVHFSPTALGQTKTKIIPLKCSARVDFDFQISFLQRHSAFTVQPLSGTVFGGGKVDIKITFSPDEYNTAHMQLQINVSQMNMKAICCSFTGTSLPGLVKEVNEKTQIENKTADLMENVTDPRALSPLNRSRTRKAEKKKIEFAPNAAPAKEIVKDGIKFPLQLNNAAAVSYVLTQKAGKIKAKDLREAVKMQSHSSPSNKQMKEAVFEHIVNKNVTEEQRNQLRWCVKLGDEGTTPVERRKVLADREKATQEYLIDRGVPQFDEELNRSTTLTSFTRIHRQADDAPPGEPSFDFYVNDVWTKRHATLRKFILAARKVMIRERVRKHTKSLAKYVSDWSKGRFSVDHSRNWEELDEEQQIINNMSTAINQKNLKWFSFPDYENPELKDDMAVDSLGVVAVPPTSVEVKTRVQFFGLRVPLQYKVLGYIPHPLSTSLYVPKGLVRPLRHGPLDSKQEVTPDVQKNDTSITESKAWMTRQNKLSSDFDGGSTKESKSSTQGTGSNMMSLQEEDHEGLHDGPFQLAMPSVLLKAREYPPLHMFNPEPGVMVYAPQLRHSEVDENHKLLPTPTERGGGSQIKLGRQDVISGSMTWKRFPCQGLVTLNSSPSMSAVYIPRWSDPFSDDLMPDNAPDLLKQLPPEDAPVENDIEGESNASLGKVLIPTMDMIHAQFTIPASEEDADATQNSESFAVTGRLPATNNPVGNYGLSSRLSKEKELDRFNQEKRDRLGQRVRTNTENLKSYVRLDARGKES